MSMRLADCLGLALLMTGCATTGASSAQNYRPAAQTNPPKVESSGNFSARLLERHNRHRAAVAAPALRWDDALAASAAQHAAYLAATEQLSHSARAGRPGQSENLWRGHKGAYAPETMVDYWADERSSFVPGIFPNVSKTGDWNDVAHYTLLIWRRTTHVGCALHSSARWDYLVCRYSPPGNKDGQAVP